VPPPAPENFLMFRIILVGAKGVGKTSIAKHFTERKWFDEQKDHGIEYRPCYRFLNDKKDFIKFFLVDCPCADAVKYYNSGYMHGILGCVIVFDLADRSTLEEALDWQETLNYSNKRNKNFIQVLVGHKKDN
jgi:GTPase SAR1 family protein